MSFSSIINNNIDPERLESILNVEVSVVYYNLSEKLACDKTEFDILFTKEYKEFTICLICPLNFPHVRPVIDMYYRIIRNSNIHNTSKYI